MQKKQMWTDGLESWSEEHERGCFFGGGGGGGGQPTQTTTVQQADPWSGQRPFLVGQTEQKNSDGTVTRPYIKGIYEAASEAYGKTGKDPYTGKMMADQNALQRQVLQDRQGLAASLSGAGNSTYNLGQATARGDFLRADNNPYLVGSIGAALTPVLSKYKNEVLPGISSAAQEQGAYGGARHGIALSRAASDVNQQMLDKAAQIGYENYGRERQLQTMAPQLIQQGAQLNDMGTGLIEQVGNTQQLWEQDQLDQAYNRWLMQQTAPWQGLSEYAGIIQNGSYGGSSSSSANMSGMSKPSALSGAIQGGLGGAMVGGLGAYGLMQAGAINAWNPVGWGMMGAGALLGGLASR